MSIYFITLYHLERKCSNRLCYRQLMTLNTYDQQAGGPHIRERLQFREGDVDRNAGSPERDLQSTCKTHL